MNFFRILLFPFAFLYNLVTRFRNYLFDIGYKKSITFEVPVISVGNLIAGGAGKTPMVEYVIRAFSGQYKMATLSRGYGRKTHGFILASDKDSANTVGDEPFQIFHKYGDQVDVAVGEERAVAIPEILFRIPETEAIVLDDAFQHRYVNPHFSILLTEFSRPFFRDYVLPMGWLRESRRGAKRADVVVVAKCPEKINPEEINGYTKNIRKHAPGKEVFFTTIKYGSPVPFSQNKPVKPEKCVLLSGIANPKPFQDYVSGNFELVDQLIFRDHHSYRQKDMNKILSVFSKYNDKISVITTEKDYVRLLPFADQIEKSGGRFYYIPIECHFLFDKNKFDKLVSDAIIAVQREKVE